MPHDPYKALYIHIPFCVSCCVYCDFTTRALAADDPAVDDYTEGLIREIRDWSRRGELASIETVYIGGGTPTHVGSRLTSLCYLLSTTLPSLEGVEWSVEANPESVSTRLVNDMWALGVNRLSLGVQSFDDEVLRYLGRAHDAQRAREAIGEAAGRFANINVDIMCGIPGQSDASLVDSIEQAVGCGATHVSIYPLTVEPATPLARDIRKGVREAPQDDAAARQMEIARDTLQGHGFARYEVANYALPGCECRHNLAYWTGVPYLGIGTSAASMTQNAQRRMRRKDGVVLDDLNPAQMRAEDLMMQMRLSRGVSVEQVEGARELLPDAAECFARLEELGLVVLEEGRYRPTDQGWLCGNELYGRIFDLA